MRIVASILLVILASCNKPDADPEVTREASPPPEALCNQAREGLTVIRNEGGLISSDGEHVIEQQSWLEIGSKQQDQLAQALAIERACESGDGRPEQEVIIRNEGGLIIVRRMVQITAEAGSFLDE